VALEVAGQSYPAGVVAGELVELAGVLGVALAWLATTYSVPAAITPAAIIANVA
jgi:hypothetical protein